MNTYHLSLVSGLLILAGAVLMVEHVLRYGYLEFELLGHETYGLIMVIAGAILGYISFRQKPGEGTS
jgi:hypothetical protein